VTEGTLESCTCDRCVAACRRKPGWFLPGEAEKAAALLGVSLEELFKTRLQVDFWLADPNVYLLSPAVVHGNPGGLFGYHSRGQCVFLTPDQRCEIHAAKPFECRIMLHGNPGNLGLKWRRANVVDPWATHQKQIEELLGYEPWADEDDNPF
jgi:Fe-S-cluster containining protein